MKPETMLAGCFTLSVSGVFYGFAVWRIAMEVSDSKQLVIILGLLFGSAFFASIGKKVVERDKQP